MKELKLNIAILMETKKKGSGLETIGGFVHFYSRVSKGKRGVSIVLKRKFSRRITD